jgi:beta-fructofuranosidase
MIHSNVPTHPFPRSARTPDHRPHLHIRPPKGWLNDPNGIGRWDGRWHVFFQYNPDAPVHAAICWGHVSSADLLHWQEEPVALRPRPGTIDAAGVWSGVAALDDGEPVLVYTAVPDHTQNAGVALARRAPDGSWIAQDMMVAPRPADPTIREVRDPSFFTIDDRRYALVGAGRTDGTPLVLVYAVDVLDTWRPLGELLTGDDPRAAQLAPDMVWECPQLIPMRGGRWALLLSRWYDHDLRGVTAMVGDLEVVDGTPRFRVDSGGPLDLGPDFYAPQAFLDGTRVLMWAWTWESQTDRAQEDVDAAGWAGALTFPRELDLDDGRVVSAPAPELIRLRRAELDAAALAGGIPAADLPAWEVEADGPLVVAIVGPDGDREVWRAPANAARVRVLVDGSVVEAFADGDAWTVRAYPRAGESWRVRADAELSAWELGLPHGP